MLKQTIFLAAFCSLSLLSQAQHLKLSTTVGIGLYNQQNVDSLFFSKSHTVSQLRIGYHWGKLGIILNTTNITQANEIEQEDPRRPIFTLQAPSRSENIRTIGTTAGLELCIPLAKRKAQLNLYTTAGTCFSNQATVGFGDINDLLYGHTSTRRLQSMFQSGFSFSYRIVPRVYAKTQFEHINYGIPYTARDIRKVPVDFTGVQRKNLFTPSIGITYKF
ncbi:MAG: hypothetical protein RL660_2666 [Bacteroidota bacterium]|jgi:hypothetical protein